MFIVEIKNWKGNLNRVAWHTEDCCVKYSKQNTHDTDTAHGIYGYVITRYDCEGGRGYGDGWDESNVVLVCVCVKWVYRVHCTHTMCVHSTHSHFIE